MVRIVASVYSYLHPIQIKASECDDSNIETKILSSLGTTSSESSRLQDKRLWLTFVADQLLIVRASYQLLSST